MGIPNFPFAITFGNSAQTALTYHDQNFRLLRRLTTKTGNVYQDMRYGYDPAGNVTSLTDPLQGTQTFGYDGLDRLTSATGPWGTYTYNALTQPGNRPLQHGVKNTGIGQPDFTYDDNGGKEKGSGVFF